MGAEALNYDYDVIDTPTETPTTDKIVRCFTDSELNGELANLLKDSLSGVRKANLEDHGLEIRKRNRELIIREKKKQKLLSIVELSMILAVDLGINTAATISVMRSDGTILGRHFCHLNKEIDHLIHSINRIKKAQQHHNCKTPRLWSRTKGINHDISVKTAQFITDIAVLYNVDIIVFEYLDRNGKLRGSKKQKLHMWRSQEVQAIVTSNCMEKCNQRDVLDLPKRVK